MASKKQNIIKRDVGIPANSRNAQLMRDFVSAHSPLYSTEALMEKMIKELSISDGKEFSEECILDFKKATVALGLSTHVPVAETVRKEYRLFLVEMVRDIEREYDCKTPSEKALAETIASAYVRTLQASQELLSARNQIESLFGLGQKTQYCSMLSKELDRANRQFTSALLTLKQLKSPSLEISVKAKTAFIGQNQQFNASVEENNKNGNNDRQ